MIAAAPAVRIEWSAAEFARMVGVSISTLRRPKYWRRYGGKKRGGRIVFSAAAVQAVKEGRA
jgi:hypothetical protein